MSINARECQKIIKNVLLPCLPNFRRSIDDSLVMWPVEHLWRGFAFGYSRETHACYFSVCVFPLYMKTNKKDPVVMRPIGNRLARGKLFVFTPDAYEASAASLRKAVLDEGVPFLNGYASPEDIICDIVSYDASPHHDILAYTHTLLGNYSKAILEIESTIGEYDRLGLDLERLCCGEQLERLALHRTLLKLLRSEPEKARQLVQELEAETIVNYRLNEIK